MICSCCVWWAVTRWVGFAWHIGASSLAQAWRGRTTKGCMFPYFGCGVFLFGRLITARQVLVATGVVGGQCTSRKMLQKQRMQVDAVQRFFGSSHVFSRFGCRIPFPCESGSFTRQVDAPLALPGAKGVSWTIQRASVCTKCEAKPFVWERKSFLRLAIHFR